MELQVLFVILFASSFALLESKLRDQRPRAFGIRKFLSTEEHIWTYSSTKPSTHRCQVDEILDVKNTSIYFKRQFYLNLQKTSRNILGKFHPGRKKHMEIVLPGRNFTVQEDILYISKNLGCAVIMITKKTQSKTTMYNLRVKNSTIIDGHFTDCKVKFNERILVLLQGTQR
ncbi:uncharacterized protein [Dermacentor albipictus]|uniref:uncharacterized protein isoform X3 n=1 Tax=Dermacentor albipictus TaxID=60249 RepID=UPI0038FCBBD1